FQAEDGIRDFHVTGVQTCALPISFAWFIAQIDDVFTCDHAYFLFCPSDRFLMMNVEWQMTNYDTMVSVTGSIFSKKPNTSRPIFPAPGYSRSSTRWFLHRWRLPKGPVVLFAEK